ncbi:ABC transporter substrate-binding protein [Streptomyces sp. NPDC059740]|uniref:ABC transporter substrate-binding protein n=1 Tax=Streptomyces sp. NPDC059740 TaxID=3346926 RepID=UPI00365AA459
MAATVSRPTSPSRKRRPGPTAAGVAALALALLLSGCGDKADDPRSGASKKSSAPLTHLLPDDIRDKGFIKVGTEAYYQPLEYLSSSAATMGLDPDIAAAMGKQLGVTFDFENGPFDGLLSGLRAKQYDVVMAGMTDTQARQDGTDPDTGRRSGGGVDFVDYFNSGVALYGRKGATDGVKSWDDLCGKRIGVERGTVSEDIAHSHADKCPAANPLDVAEAEDDEKAQAQLASGAVDFVSSDYPVAAHAVQESHGSNALTLIGRQVEAAPYGIAVAKDNTRLRDALSSALDAIIKNGEYAKILAKWDVKDGAVPQAVVNGGK